MSSPADLVREFHHAFDRPLRDSPPAYLFDIPDVEIELRGKLILEEAREAYDALQEGDVAHLAKELADLIYVAYGTAVQFGIDLDACLAAVHKNNMAKVWPDGTVHLREDGKVLKSPDWEPLDLSQVLGL